jgi:hypothetical protein
MTELGNKKVNRKNVQVMQLNLFQTDIGLIWFNGMKKYANFAATRTALPINEH